MVVEGCRREDGQAMNGRGERKREERGLRRFGLSGEGGGIIVSMRHTAAECKRERQKTRRQQKSNSTPIGILFYPLISRVFIVIWWYTIPGPSIGQSKRFYIVGLYPVDRDTAPRKLPASLLIPRVYLLLVIKLSIV